MIELDRDRHLVRCGAEWRALPPILWRILGALAKRRTPVRVAGLLPEHSSPNLPREHVKRLRRIIRGSGYDIAALPHLRAGCYELRPEPPRLSRTLAGITLAAVLAIAAPAHAQVVQGVVTFWNADNQCVYFELGSTGPLFTIAVGDPNYEALLIIIRDSFEYNRPMVVGATSGVACGNQHVTALYVGTYN